MTRAKDFYSKSVAEAIRQACAEFGTSQENLDIEVLATGSAGIFGLCKKRAHIRASLKQSEAGGEPETGRSRKRRPAAEQAERQAEKERKLEDLAGAGGEAEEPVPVPARTEKKRPPVIEEKDLAETVPVESRGAGEEETPEPPSEEALESVRSHLDQLLRHMGLESTVAVKFADGSVQCHISGAYEEQIIGPEGRTLDSLLYLIRKMMARELPERFSIDIDAGNFRERRNEELKKTALEFAEQVKEDGKTRSIPALNPSERRVVHVALQDDKEVRSRSVGDGLFKKVLIYKPGKNRKSGPRRRGRQSGGQAAK
ncbi:MAG: Jag N-terminal domain-containing protein [Desulfobulbaceae bacterium]|jgi:spoIIIJ-associated protein|nr:Jag N-terminal domain-containing protein [Desulfobulbaceae bacterium]